MKFISGLCALLLSGLALPALAGTESSPAKDVIQPAAAAPCTLFPSNQWGVSIFGEYEGGNIDIGVDRSPVYTTTVKVGSPSHPGFTVGPGGVIVIAGARLGPKVHVTTRATAGLRPGFSSPSFKIVTVNGVKVLQTTTVSRSYPNPEHIQHNAGGGGTQLSYFFSRYFGVALEGDFLGGSDYLTQLSGQFIARYPMEFAPKPSGGYSKDSGYSKDDKNPVTSCPTWGLAPYFICGGGGQWDGSTIGLADVGAGIEFRCKANWGLFCDGRWFVRNTRQNFAAVRLGLSYNF